MPDDRLAWPRQAVASRLPGFVSPRFKKGIQAGAEMEDRETGRNAVRTTRSVNDLNNGSSNPFQRQKQSRSEYNLDISM